MSYSDQKTHYFHHQTTEHEFQCDPRYFHHDSINERELIQSKFHGNKVTISALLRDYYIPAMTQHHNINKSCPLSALQVLEAVKSMEIQLEDIKLKLQNTQYLEKLLEGAKRRRTSKTTEKLLESRAKAHIQYQNQSKSQNADIYNEVDGWQSIVSETTNCTLSDRSPNRFRTVEGSELNQSHFQVFLQQKISSIAQEWKSYMMGMMEKYESQIATLKEDLAKATRQIAVNRHETPNISNQK